MRKIILLGGIFLFLSALGTPVKAQNRDSVNNTTNEDILEEFRRRNERVFQNFRDSIDQVFIEFMRNNWEEFNVFPGKKSPLDAPKPDKQPQSPPKQDNVVPEKIETPPPRRQEAPELVPLPPRKKELPEREKELNFQTSEGPKTMDAGFYDVPFQLSMDPAYRYVLRRPYNSGIPDAWTELAAAPFFPQLYKEVNIIADAMQLNDWGYLMLIKKTAERLYPTDPNQQIIFTCFTLNKSGYQVKMGYNRDDIFLLVPGRQQVYEKPFLTIEGVQFYVFTFGRPLNKKLPIATYKGQYGESSRIIDFTFKRPLRLSNRTVSKPLNFEYNYQTYNVDISYNPTMIDFYSDMPHVDFEVTLSSPLSTVAFESIKKGLLPILEGKSEADQINILLRFVQKAFEYKTDQDQFGVEKYLYPEEVLHYPFSDCEDRSAMFSTLVRNILGLEVIGLIFPNHLATAVKTKGEVQGDFIEHNGEKYIICDPTYIGADVGMCMPKFKNAQIELVLLN